MKGTWSNLGRRKEDIRNDNHKWIASDGSELLPTTDGLKKPYLAYLTPQHQGKSCEGLGCVQEQEEYARKGISLDPNLYLVKLMVGGIDRSYDEGDEG
jgi:hypothetical protein